jgi:protein-tyrosine phosphatase
MQLFTDKLSNWILLKNNADFHCTLYIDKHLLPMFFLKNKNRGIDRLSWLGADMHSHLLPGIDDGSPDSTTSIELIKGLCALGYKKIITTPHVLWELYPNTSAIIQNKTADMRKALSEAGIEVEFHAAAEYFMDDHFAEGLKKRAPLLTISGNMVLVEFSMISAPLDLQEVLFEMQMQDYQPVIAHPERYTYLMRKKEVFETLKSAGCLFQLNLLSLSGYYGEAVLRLADYLLKNNYYSLVGTDLHHAGHLAQLQKIPSSLIKRLQDSGIIKNHLL